MIWYYLQFLLTLLFIFHLARVVFYETYLWQLKEYRFDRMMVHLKTSQGKKLLWNWLVILKWVILALYSLSLFTAGYNDVLFIWIFASSLYFFEFVYSLFIAKTIIKRPKFTIRSFTIIFIVIMINLLLLFFLDIDRLLMIIYLDRLLPLLIILSIIVTGIPIGIIKNSLKFMAKRKIGSMDRLKVVGIAGSYGKTSTKEFLAGMIGEKYKVLKTSGSQNTAIGIASTILRRMDRDTGIFIAEMGAYKRGEIAEIAQMIKPDIGVITGINYQHLELFGSIDNTVSAKYELIRKLKPKGYAIFNYDNKHVRKMAEWTKQIRPDLTVWAYGRSKDVEVFDGHAVHILNSLAGKEKVVFSFRVGKTVLHCESKLLGIQNIENIAAASCISLILRLSCSDLKNSISRLEPPPKTMKIVKKSGKAVFVDDTFNANPDGVMAALDYMKIYSGNKILILTPLVELGNQSRDVHQRLGEAAGRICERILLTNINFNDSFIAGVRKVTKKTDKVQVVNTSLAKKIIEKTAKKDSIAVFEGREAGRILESLNN